MNVFGRVRYVTSNVRLDFGADLDHDAAREIILKEFLPIVG